MPEHREELRRKVGSTKLLLPGTSALLVDEENRVLLMLRTDRQEWGLPGGYLDIGETVRDSLRRELREELHVTSSDETLFGVYSGSEFDNVYPNGDQTAGVTAVFVVRAFDGSLRDSSESSQLRFYSLALLPSPLNHLSARILLDYRKHLDGDLSTPIIL